MEKLTLQAKTGRMDYTVPRLKFAQFAVKTGLLMISALPD